jgi:23S rRNA (cytidine1920-2'-O)/16S rRNA (cytidine1409-2'-O)-methyltransferase
MNSFHRRSSRPATPPDANAERTIERHGMSRLDSLLVSRGLAPSRTAAQRMIAAGRVSLNGAPCSSRPTNWHRTAHCISRPMIMTASRRAAASSSRGRWQNRRRRDRKNCLDVGQSTGGFTDCLLQAGAQQVVGVDVGHGQLATKLKADPRVVALEGINCRALSAEDLGAALQPVGSTSSSAMCLSSR